MVSQPPPFSRAVAWLLGIVSIWGLVHVPRANAAPESGPKRSPITVHVLDTTLGKPGAALTVVLERKIDSS